jgi:predicted CoA-binding protein
MRSPASPSEILNPRSIAVVGVSDNPGKAGGRTA